MRWLFLLAFPGAPCIYYGDEVAVDGENDPDCRKSFPWEESGWDQDLLAYVKELIALRKQTPALRRGEYGRLWSVNGTYAFSRSLDGSTFIIALNVSDATQEATVVFRGQDPKVIFGQASEVNVNDGRLNFKIPARCGVIFG